MGTVGNKYCRPNPIHPARHKEQGKKQLQSTGRRAQQLRLLVKPFWNATPLPTISREQTTAIMIMSSPYHCYCRQSRLASIFNATLVKSDVFLPLSCTFVLFSLVSNIALVFSVHNTFLKTPYRRIRLFFQLAYLKMSIY